MRYLQVYALVENPFKCSDWCLCPASSFRVVASQRILRHLSIKASRETPDQTDPPGAEKPDAGAEVLNSSDACIVPLFPQ